MITASFSKKNGKFYKFRISGHSGYAESGRDIVCAAVSSMTMLTINNITDTFGISALADVNPEGPIIDFRLESEDERGCALIAGLEREISVLAEDYPKFVRVILK